MLIEIFNTVYEKYGFDGVIEEITDRLKYGTVKKTDTGLYRISTAGYSDDEIVLASLTFFTCIFGYKHYVGFLRGGHYYFSRDRDMDNIEIIQMIPKKSMGC